MRFKMLLMLGLALSLSLIRSLSAEDKPDPRESLDTAVPEAVRLLEAKDYEGLLKTFVAPKELEQIVEKGDLKDLAKSFGGNKAERLLKVLQAAKGLMPTYNDDQTLATYKLPEKIESKGEIRFQKIEKLWYIKN